MGVERCRTGSREVLDCPQCGSQISRTGCEPELHPRFRFEVWQMAILAEPAPEPEVRRVGWEIFWASFSMFSPNQVLNLRHTGFAPEP